MPLDQVAKLVGMVPLGKKMAALLWFPSSERRTLFP
jgi:hypothetical protein